MKPLAVIIFTVTSGPNQGLQISIREHCTRDVLEYSLALLDSTGLPAMAQCEYGNGPLTSPRPIARSDQ